MTDAAEARSRLSRTWAFPQIRRASFTISSDLPRTSSTSASQNSSKRDAKAPEGLRAPFATARSCDPSSASMVRIRSVSPSFVLRMTNTRARYVGRATKAPYEKEMETTLLYASKPIVPETCLESPDTLKVCPSTVTEVDATPVAVKDTSSLPL